MSRSEQSAGSATGEAVWFALPIPTPLWLPDNYGVAFPRSATPEDVEAYGPLSHLLASVTVRQVDIPDEGILVADALRRFVEDPGSYTPDSAPTAEFIRPLTFAVVGVPRRANGDDDEVAAELETAVDVVQRLQLAHTATLHTPDDLLTLANLPPVIPISFGRMDRNGKPVSDRRAAQLLLDHPSDSFTRVSRSLDDETLEVFDLWLERLRDHPLHTFIGLRRDVLVQAHLRGDDRLTAVLAAMAGEVLLETLLLVLLWEDGVSPEDAAKVCDYTTRTHVQRVTAEIPSRLKGGGWKLDGSGSLGKYWADTVHLRHRVVHTGYTPTTDEADDAVAGLSELERFLGDRLAESVTQRRRYLRTASMLYGGGGLESRDAITRALEALKEDPGQPNWIPSFNLWRRFVDRNIDPDAPPPANDPTTVRIEIWVLPDGTVGVYLVDPPSIHGAELDEETARELISNPETQSWITAVKGVAAKSGLPEIKRIAGEVQMLIADVTWCPYYEVLPGFTVSPDIRSRATGGSTLRGPTQ